MDTLGGGSLWFTSAIVVSQLVICIMLYKKTSIWFYAILSVLLAFFANLIASFNIEIFQSPSFPWYYKSGLIAVLFMVIGGLYWKYEEQVSLFIKTHKWILIVFLVLYCILIRCRDWVHCNTIAADVNLWGVFATCLSSIFIIHLFKLFKLSNSVTFIGRNSICFYFLSGAIPNIIAIVTNKIIPHPHYIYVPVLAIVAFGIAWVAVKLMTRFTPFLFDLRKLYK